MSCQDRDECKRSYRHLCTKFAQLSASRRSAAGSEGCWTADSPRLESHGGYDGVTGQTLQQHEEMRGSRQGRASSAAALSQEASGSSERLTAGAIAALHRDVSISCRGEECDSGAKDISEQEHIAAATDVHGLYHAENLRNPGGKSTMTTSGEEVAEAAGEELGARTRQLRSRGHFEAGSGGEDKDEPAHGSSSEGNISSQGESVRDADLDIDSLRGGRWLEADAARFG